MKDKRYIILGKTRKGVYVGQVENSFSMGISEDEVRVYAPEYKGTYRREGNVNQEEWNWCCKQAERLNKKMPHIEWRAYRVGSQFCPVIVDFSLVDKMKKNKAPYDKYKARNQKFYMKEKITSSQDGQ